MTTRSAVQPDLTLLLDDEGIIRDASLFNGIAQEGVQAWLGQPWVDTVAGGMEQIRRMVEDARITGFSAFGQVMQRFPSGLQLPIEYNAVRLGGKAGLLAIGRNVLAVAELQSRLIAAQQAMERDYWKLRQVETRYRLLFDASAEAVMLIDAETLSVLEANPAAIRAVGVPAGEDLVALFAPSERDAFRQMLVRTREQKKTPGQLVHLGPDRKPWMIRASLMVAEPGPVFLLQFSELAGLSTDVPARSGPLSLEHMMDRLPDGFVIVDREGIVRRANPAFLGLVEVGTVAGVIGEPLSRWLSRPGADATVLMTTLRRHRMVRNFRTKLEGDLGAETDVEISACDDRDENPHFVGLVVRSRARVGESANSAALPELEPGMPLRELVQQSIGSVERHYIQAALKRSQGNRTVAAELLGLSRQTLYSKLDRYDLNGHETLNTELPG